jgi:hypothetical protein
VAVGDLDGDAHLDVVVANHEGNDISVFLNDGAGRFQRQRRIAVGAGPASIAIGDFGRGHGADIVVVNRDSNDVTVLQNPCWDWQGSVEPGTRWITLSDGGSLEGWHKARPNHGTWYVENAAIWCERDEQYKTLLTDDTFGPGTLRVTVIPGHEGARLGIGYAHDEQSRGPLLMYTGDKFTWIRGYREDYPPDQPGNWLSFPGPTLAPDERVEFEVEYGPLRAIARVNGVELQELPGSENAGHIALHVWADDAGGFKDIAFRPTFVAEP